MLEPGSKIVKVACPDPNCRCDGKIIPPGTPGMIHTSDKGESVRLQSLADGTKENYYLCVWETVPVKKSAWWTYEHGIELEGHPFPDMSYLEDVE